MKERSGGPTRSSRIHVTNFKSLVDFRLDLAKFTCLIGLNGAGKSTVLQFIDFLGQQARGNMKGWLDERHWAAKEIPSHLTNKKNVEFVFKMSSGAGEADIHWYGVFNPALLHCTTEKFDTPDASLYVEGGHISMFERSGNGAGRRRMNEPVRFSYEGSVLSQLRDSSLPEILVQVKNYIQSIKSLDLLSPEHLRQRTREAAGSMGLGGQGLSAFLHEIGPSGRKKVSDALRKVYKQLKNVNTKSLRSGWKQLEIHEIFGRKEVVTEARHINDGMLRVLALLAELQSDNQFLLFDEIENGINPELVQFLLDTLTSATQQVLVTTHSPLILNYLSDEAAKAGVIYLYKNKQGATNSIPFFSIPSLAKKLSVMGPGEAFADTNLTQLDSEIEAMPEQPSEETHGVLPS